MAHQSNVIQVKQSLASDSGTEEVVDPVCRKRLSRRECRHMMFRDEGTYYFCSKECQARFKPGTPSIKSEAA